MTTLELIERGVGANCLSDAYDMGKADAEVEHKAMCETCVHKVSKSDIDAVYQQGRADQKKEDNEFFNFEGAWELEKQKIRADAIIECLQIVQKIKDDYNYAKFGEQIPINYGTLCGIIIELEQLKERKNEN